MAIPKLTDQNILDAMKYIDENGTPGRNNSKNYVLITDDGKSYSPKYVIAVARHLATGEVITTDNFQATEARDFFQNRGYTIDVKQDKYELVITADSIISSDEKFSMDNIGYGDSFKPLEVYYKSPDGEIVTRNYNKGERRNTNQTLPRLACQVFEPQIVSLSTYDKEQFPICQYTPSSPVYRGIFSSVDEFKKHINTIEYLIYSRENGPQFVLYCWNIFSTLLFVQECLKRFGNEGDQFVLSYREKTEQEKGKSTETVTEDDQEASPADGPKNPYSKILKQSKNIIFRGAPGTGKSYLAKEIAADIISDGMYDSFSDLTEAQKAQIEFVQFHPSYDYSDFVEGLRPKMNADGSMGFELKDGVFKRFVDRARRNYEDSKKSTEVVEQEVSAKAAMTEFFMNVEFGEEKFKTIKGNEFTITDVDDKHIIISIPGNATIDKLSLNIDELQRMLESDVKFEKVSDITEFFGKQFATQAYSYEFVIYNAIKERINMKPNVVATPEEQKKYIFIIDEINRGEMSKILGELFFSIDPGYRGIEGAVSTQYANMHDDPNDKFYIPENVYIIGTMNDIDRSVDSFDFAMRRRFRFIEITADESSAMLEGELQDDLRQEACKRMSALNKEIKNVTDLNENYQIGAAYFLKLKYMTFDELWNDCIKPILQDYVRGMYDEDAIMKRFASAYGYVESSEDNVNAD